MNDPTRDVMCPKCNGECYDYPYYSECCSSPMTNWPDSDLCSDCHDHSNPSPCDLCDGCGMVDEDTAKNYKQDIKEGIKCDTMYKRKHGE